jgi:hypothetical protein
VQLGGNFLTLSPDHHCDWSTARLQGSLSDAPHQSFLPIHKELLGFSKT